MPSDESNAPVANPEGTTTTRDKLTAWSCKTLTAAEDAYFRRLVADWPIPGPAQLAMVASLRPTRPRATGGDSTKDGGRHGGDRAA